MVVQVRNSGTQEEGDEGQELTDVIGYVVSEARVGNMRPCLKKPNVHAL